MKLWWDNAIAANLDTTDAWIDDYEKAAALLVKWADEPEDSKRSQEVRGHNSHIYVHLLV
jgi:hypothetical protein